MLDTAGVKAADVEGFQSQVVVLIEIQIAKRKQYVNGLGDAVRQQVGRVHCVDDAFVHQGNVGAGNVQHLFDAGQVGDVVDLVDDRLEEFRGQRLHVHGDAVEVEVRQIADGEIIGIGRVWIGWGGAPETKVAGLRLQAARRSISHRHGG